MGEHGSIFPKGKLPFPRQPVHTHTTMTHPRRLILRPSVIVLIIKEVDVCLLGRPTCFAIAVQWL